MDGVQTQILLAGSSILQAVIASILWVIVFYCTRHRGAWLLVAFLPLLGILLAPMVNAMYWFRSENVIFFTLFMGVFHFIFSIAPLFILALRLMKGHVPLGREADVFDD